jgi:ABC-type transport system involved in multi-copper enzyme maturation permease subunit
VKTLRALKGWLPVAAKEGRATILSPRLLIIAAILALAVLAGTYAILPGAGGGGGAPSRIAYGFTYYPDLNASRPASALFLATPTGEPLAGVDVHLVNVTLDRLGPEETEVLETKPTDSSGWVRFEGLAARYPDRNLALTLADDPERTYAYVYTGREIPDERMQNQGQLRTALTALGGSPNQQTYSLVFIDLQGTPLEGADVFILELSEGLAFDPFGEDPPEGWDPYWNGTTDANGYYLRSEPLESGEYVVRVAKEDLSERDRFGFFVGPSPFAAGPDGVLAFSALIFLPILLPIMALVLAYDAVAREKSEGSLDLLLSKPVSRVGVALGKLAGVFGSMAVPVAVILLAAAALIWVQTDQAPTASFLASLVGEALFLLLAYTLVFLAVSALVRNLGTALLVSVLLFLLFAFFWGLISFLVASLIASPGSVRWFEVIMAMSLFTPTGVYQQLLSLSLPDVLGGFFGPIGGTAAQLPVAWIALSGVLWIAVPVTLFLWTMKYRVTEG